MQQSVAGDGAIPGQTNLARARAALPICLGLLSLPIAACASQHPRLDTAGEPVTRYVYAVPEQRDDGWATASLHEVGIEEAPITQMVEGILAREFPNIHSILLVKDGKLVLEEYFYGYDRERLHELHSVSKSVTALLIGIAVDKGLIADLDRPVYTYFPDAWGTPWVAEPYDITVRHLLTMSAGLAWDESSHPYDDPRNSIVAMLRSESWLRYVLERPRAEAPGQRYVYNGGLTLLLGAILQRASRLPADKFAERHLLGPLGIAAYRWYRHPDGTIGTPGGLSLRPRDLAKIGAVMLNGGLWQGRRIVSQAWVEAATRVQIEIEPGDWGYGYQWYRIDTEHCGRPIEAFAAIGRGGQYIVVAPDLDQMAVFTSQPYENAERLYLPLTLLKEFVLPASLPPGFCSRPAGRTGAMSGYAAADPPHRKQ